MKIDGDPAQDCPMDDDSFSQDAATRAEHAGTGGDVSRAGDIPSESGPALVTIHPSAENREKLRIVEALLFAATEPLDIRTLAENLEVGEDVEKLLAELQANYASRGVNLKCIGGRWTFRTAEDLAYLLEKHAVEQRRLSRAALETLAIIAYHQPATRAEIEEIRGVSTSKGTLDVLLETGWVKLRGRRRAPGRPVTYGTSPAFIEHFGFESIADLPGMNELKGAGLLSANLPADFVMPVPTDLPDLTQEEYALEDEEGEEEDENRGGNLDLFDEVEDDEAIDNLSPDR